MESEQPPSVDLGIYLQQSDALRTDQGSLLSTDQMCLLVGQCHAHQKGFCGVFSIAGWRDWGIVTRHPPSSRAGDDLRGLHPPAKSCCLHLPCPPSVPLRAPAAPPGLWGAWPEGSLGEVLLGIFPRFWYCVF